MPEHGICAEVSVFARRRTLIVGSYRMDIVLVSGRIDRPRAEHGIAQGRKQEIENV